MKAQNFGKKKTVDLVGYMMILAHNKAIDGVMNEKQIDLMMNHLQNLFENDEEKALKFIKNNAIKYMKQLETYYEQKGEKK